MKPPWLTPMEQAKDITDQYLNLSEDDRKQLTREIARAIYAAVARAMEELET